MLILAGLGNPGREYAGHRHNIGFMALDRIAEDHGFSPWRAKFQGLVSDGRLGSEKVLLLKPQTFMNLSGQAVGEAMRFHKIAPEEIWVFHDELDLAPGKLRVKRGGGHAGHNGLRSLHQHCGPEYGRVRMGIGHPGRKELVSGYVLHDFSKYDQLWLDDMLRGISDGAAKLAAGDESGFMNAVALRLQPAKPTKPKPAPKAKPEDRAGDANAGDRAGDAKAGDRAGDAKAGDRAGEAKAGDRAGDAKTGEPALSALEKLKRHFT